MIASRHWLVFGRPLYLVIACCILSGLEVVVLYLSSRFGHAYLDHAQLTVVFTLVLPIALFLCLPLLSVMAHSQTLGKRLLLYVLAIVVFSVLRPVLLSAFPRDSTLAGSAAQVCAQAAESFAFSARAACLSQISLSMLFINAVWWALPVALIEFVLRQHEGLRPPTGVAE